MESSPCYRYNAIGFKRSVKPFKQILDGICPGQTLDEEVEQELSNMTSDFIENVLTNACKMAKNRQSDTLEYDDVMLYLKDTFNMNPLCITDENMYYVNKHPGVLDAGTNQTPVEAVPKSTKKRIKTREQITKVQKQSSDIEHNASFAYGLNTDSNHKSGTKKSSTDNDITEQDFVLANNEKCSDNSSSLEDLKDSKKQNCIKTEKYNSRPSVSEQSTVVKNTSSVDSVEEYSKTSAQKDMSGKEETVGTTRKAKLPSKTFHNEKRLRRSKRNSVSSKSEESMTQNSVCDEDLLEKNQLISSEVVSEDFIKIQAERFKLSLSKPVTSQTAQLLKEADPSTIESAAENVQLVKKSSVSSCEAPSISKKSSRNGSKVTNKRTKTNQISNER